MQTRSSRREVRNPILALDSAQRILALPLDQRLALADLLMELSRDARQRADKAWATRKPPMALYWAATAVVAKHIARRRSDDEGGAVLVPNPNRQWTI